MADIETRQRRSWQLRVTETRDIGPRMRRIFFTAPDLAEFNYRPGQAVSLQIPVGDGQTGRRDYTIRALDRMRAELAIDFVTGRSTPAVAWALTACPGQTIEAIGPRGRTVVNPEARWHLFSGDESCIPAIFHMIEMLPGSAQAFAFLEVGGQDDAVEVKSDAGVKLTWLFRGAQPPGPSVILLDCIQQFDIPPCPGHAYIIGETSNVRRQRQALIARGMPRPHISAEGYWRPGRIGGNDLITD